MHPYRPKKGPKISCDSLFKGLADCLDEKKNRNEKYHANEPCCFIIQEQKLKAGQHSYPQVL
jgi:hypothetical protein